MRRVVLLTAVAAALATLCTADNTTLIPYGSQWKYYDTGAIQLPTWTATAFGDGTFKQGPAPLGYNCSFLRTVVARGYTTTYYRTYFNLAALPVGYSYVVLTLTVEDGAIAYLNGYEVSRFNMPSGGVVPASTLALTQVTVADPSESSITVLLPSANLNPGRNCLAVELHTGPGKVAHALLDGSLVLVAVPTPSVSPSITSTRTDTPSPSPSLSFTPLPVGPEQIGWTTVWRYYDQGVDLGSAWTTAAFDDSAWRSGRAVLGTAAADCHWLCSN